jgi:subtilisin family serine protease
MDPGLWDVMEGGLATEVVAVLLRLRPGAGAPPGARLVTRHGEIATARVERGAIVALRAHPDVISVKAARELRPELDRRPARAARRNPWRGDGPSGTGVVIGIVDWGLDVTHPNFTRADGTTRIDAIWDQRDGDLMPYGYGRLIIREDIDAALATQDPFGALGYDPLDADIDGNGTHGTHVTDIAAGSIRVGRGGVAPGAEIVFVHLATERTGPRSIANSVSLLEAIDFISHRAGDRPCVINLSLGSHAGPHDGTTLVEQALDAFVTSRPGRAIVQSAGNYRRAPIHATEAIVDGRAATLVWEVSSRDTTTNELDVWYPGADRLAIELRDDRGERVARALPDEHGPIVVNGELIGRYAHRTNDPNNHDNHAAFVLEPRGMCEDWTVIIEPLAVVSDHAHWHAWIERDEGGPRTQSRLRSASLSTASTIGTIANGHYTIVVGAIDGATGELGPFSSAGPTRDGRFKPDLLAPGVDEVAARSASDDGALLTSKNGTSMAAPHVTGAVALLYEANHGLDIHELRAALGITGTSEPAVLDIEAAVARMRRTDTRLADAVATPPPSSNAVGHEPTHDWSSGTMRVDAELFEADRTTLGKGARRFLKGTAVTLKRAKDDWVELEGIVHESAHGRSPIPVGRRRGWVRRAQTTMSRGVFKDLRIRDRSDNPKQLAPAKAVTSVVLQPGPASGAGAHYLIDKAGTIVLLTSLDLEAEPETRHSIAITHVGEAHALRVPDTAMEKVSIRAFFKTIPLSPKLRTRLLALTDAELVQLANDHRKDPQTRPKVWQLYQDISGPQKRGSFLLVNKLLAELGLTDAAVLARAQGETLREFHTARRAYPGLVAKLETLVGVDATFEPVLTKERALIAALAVDGTAAEHHLVSSGTDAPATARERLRTHYYDDFWVHATRLAELVDRVTAHGSTHGTHFATLLAAWRTWPHDHR